LLRQQPVWLIELDQHCHIDCLYTHPRYQCRGVAQTLYNYVESLALSRHLPRLYVEASLPAQRFFERQGFCLQGRNLVHRHDQVLVNVSMEKYLDDRSFLPAAQCGHFH